MSFPYELIGICGFARTGKDALARFLEGLLSDSNQRCKVTSFAYYLKKDIDDGLPALNADDIPLKKLHENGRYAIFEF